MRTLALVALLVGCKHPVGAGRDSLDDVVRASVAAVAAGDVDALVALADPVGLYDAVLACDDDDDADGATEEAAHRAGARDPAAVLAKTRADFARLARASGALEVVAIEPGTTNDIAEGAPLVDGCHANRPLRFHRPRVTVRVAGRAQLAAIAVTEVAGRYFLATPPVLR